MPHSSNQDLRFNAVLEDNVSPKVDAIATKMQKLGATKHEIKLFIKAYDEASTKAKGIQDQLGKLPKKKDIKINLDQDEAARHLERIRQEVHKPIEYTMKLKQNFANDAAEVKQHFSNLKTQINQEVAQLPVISNIGRATNAAVSAGPTNVMGAVGALGLTGLAKQSVEQNSQYEQDIQSLRSTLKDPSKAQTEMAGITEFARKTPFNQPDVLQSDIQMRQYGIQPQGPVGMKQAGNLAAGTGQPLDRAMLAIIDSTRRGDFRVARGMGLNIDAQDFQPGGRFTGMSVEQGVGKLINQRFSGSMNLQAQTLQGRLSNLQDVSQLSISQPMGKTAFGIARAGAEKANSMLTGDSEGALRIQRQLGEVVEAVNKGTARLYALVGEGKTVFESNMLGPLKEIGAAVQQIVGDIGDGFGGTAAVSIQYMAQAFNMIIQPMSKIIAAVPQLGQLFGYMKAFQMVGLKGYADPFERLFKAVNPLTFSLRNLFRAIGDLVSIGPRLGAMFAIKNIIDLHTGTEALRDSFQRHEGNADKSAVLQTSQARIDLEAPGYSKGIGDAKQMAAQVGNALPDDIGAKRRTHLQDIGWKHMASVESKYGDSKAYEQLYLNEVSRRGAKTPGEMKDIGDDTVRSVRSVKSVLNESFKKAATDISTGEVTYKEQLAKRKGPISTGPIGAALAVQMEKTTDARKLTDDMILGRGDVKAAFGGGAITNPVQLVQKILENSRAPSADYMKLVRKKGYNVEDFATFGDITEKKGLRDDEVAAHQKERNIRKYDAEAQRQLRGIPGAQDVKLPSAGSQYLRQGAAVPHGLTGANQVSDEIQRQYEVLGKVEKAVQTAGRDYALLQEKQKRLSFTQEELNNQMAIFQHREIVPIQRKMAALGEEIARFTQGHMVPLQRAMEDVGQAAADFAQKRVVPIQRALEDLGNAQAQYQQNKVVPLQRAMEDWEHTTLKVARALEDVSFKVGKAQFNMDRYSSSMLKGDQALLDQIHSLDMYSKKLEFLRLQNQGMMADITKTNFTETFKQVIKPVAGFSLSRMSELAENRKRMLELRMDLDTADNGMAKGDVRYERDKAAKRAGFGGREIGADAAISGTRRAAEAIFKGTLRTRELTDAQHDQVSTSRKFEDQMYRSQVAMRRFEDQTYRLNQAMFRAQKGSRHFADEQYRIQRSMHGVSVEMRPMQDHQYKLERQMYQTTVKGYKFEDAQEKLRLATHKLNKELYAQQLRMDELTDLPDIIKNQIKGLQEQLDKANHGQSLDQMKKYLDSLHDAGILSDDLYKSLTRSLKDPQQQNADVTVSIWKKATQQILRSFLGIFSGETWVRIFDMIKQGVGGIVKGLGIPSGPAGMLATGVGVAAASTAGLYTVNALRIAGWRGALNVAGRIPLLSPLLNTRIPRLLREDVPKVPKPAWDDSTEESRRRSAAARKNWRRQNGYFRWGQRSDPANWPTGRDAVRSGFKLNRRDLFHPMGWARGAIGWTAGSALGGAVGGPVGNILGGFAGMMLGERTSLRRIAGGGLSGLTRVLRGNFRSMRRLWRLQLPRRSDYGKGFRAPGWMGRDRRERDRARQEAGKRPRGYRRAIREGRQRAQSRAYRRVIREGGTVRQARRAGKFARRDAKPHWGTRRRRFREGTRAYKAERKVAREARAAARSAGKTAKSVSGLRRLPGAIRSFGRAVKSFAVAVGAMSLLGGMRGGRGAFRRGRQRFKDFFRRGGRGGGGGSSGGWFSGGSRRTARGGSYRRGYDRAIRRSNARLEGTKGLRRFFGRGRGRIGAVGRGALGAARSLLRGGGGGKIAGIARLGFGAAKGVLRKVGPLSLGFAALDAITAGGGIGNRAQAVVSGATFGLGTKLLGWHSDADKATKKFKELRKELEQYSREGNVAGLKKVSKEFDKLAHKGGSWTKAIGGRKALEGLSLAAGQAAGDVAKQMEMKKARRILTLTYDSFKTASKQGLGAVLNVAKSNFGYMRKLMKKDPEMGRQFAMEQFKMLTHSLNSLLEHGKITATTYLKQIHKAAIKHGVGGAKGMAGAFTTAKEAIQDAMRQGKISAADGAKAIDKLLTDMLTKMGFTGSEVKKLVKANVSLADIASGKDLTNALGRGPQGLPSHKGPGDGKITKWQGIKSFQREHHLRVDGKDGPQTRAAARKTHTHLMNDKTNKALPGYAGGLDRVPKDDYLARLHKDEMILAAGEANRWRKRIRGNNTDEDPEAKTQQMFGKRRLQDARGFLRKEDDQRDRFDKNEQRDDDKQKKWLRDNHVDHLKRYRDRQQDWEERTRKEKLDWQKKAIDDDDDHKKKLRERYLDWDKKATSEHTDWHEKMRKISDDQLDKHRAVFRTGLGKIDKTMDSFFSGTKKTLQAIDALTKDAKDDNKDDKKAHGGVVGDETTLGAGKRIIVGEEGFPEVIIPLAPHRRDRAVSLMKQTAGHLGQAEKFANGGMAGGDDKSLPKFAPGGFVSAPGIGAVTPRTLRIAEYIKKHWHIGTIGGYRQDAFPEHPSGRALDIMVGNSRHNKHALRQGNSIAHWLLANQQALNTKHVIWRQRINSGHGGWRHMENRGGDTANHMDHVHVWFNPGGGKLGDLSKLIGVEGDGHMDLTKHQKRLLKAAGIKWKGDGPLKVPKLDKVKGMDGKLGNAMERLLDAKRTGWQKKLKTMVGKINDRMGPSEGDISVGSGPRKKEIWKYFKGRGLSDYAVAGIMGNMQIESGFRLNAPESGFQGLVQWDQGRWGALTSQAKAAGRSPFSLQAQLDYIWYELTHGERGALSSLRGASGAMDAAAIWDSQFERSAGTSRGARMAAASSIYKKYHGKKFANGGMALPRFNNGGLISGHGIGKLTPRVFGIANRIQDHWHVNTIGGYRPADGYDEHNTGRAMDIMVGNSRHSKASLNKGNQIAHWLLQNDKKFRLKWVIWRQRIAHHLNAWRKMGDRGNDTQNHYDHVHAFFAPGGARIDFGKTDDDNNDDKKTSSLQDEGPYGRPKIKGLPKSVTANPFQRIGGAMGRVQAAYKKKYGKDVMDTENLKGMQHYNHKYPRHSLSNARGHAHFSSKIVRRIAEYAGFNPGHALQMDQIAHGESQRYPGVVAGDGGLGLWQMTPWAWGKNSAAAKHMRKLGGADDMLNPIKNAAMAMYLYLNAGKTFRPWYGKRYLQPYHKGTKSALLANGGIMPGALAGGLQNVPRDNFPALLHRGERVMTQAENASDKSSTKGLNRVADRLEQIRGIILKTTRREGKTSPYWERAIGLLQDMTNEQKRLRDISQRQFLASERKTIRGMTGSKGEISSFIKTLKSGVLRQGGGTAGLQQASDEMVSEHAKLNVVGRTETASAIKRVNKHFKKDSKALSTAKKRVSDYKKAHKKGGYSKAEKKHIGVLKKRQQKAQDKVTADTTIRKMAGWNADDVLSAQSRTKGKVKEWGTRISKANTKIRKDTRDLNAYKRKHAKGGFSKGEKAHITAVKKRIKTTRSNVRRARGSLHHDKVALKAIDSVANPIIKKYTAAATKRGVSKNLMNAIFSQAKDPTKNINSDKLIGDMGNVFGLSRSTPLGGKPPSSRRSSRRATTSSRRSTTSARRSSRRATTPVGARRAAAARRTTAKTPAAKKPSAVAAAAKKLAARAAAKKSGAKPTARKVAPKSAGPREVRATQLEGLIKNLTQAVHDSTPNINITNNGHVESKVSHKPSTKAKKVSVKKKTK